MLLGEHFNFPFQNHKIIQYSLFNEHYRYTQLPWTHPVNVEPSASKHHSLNPSRSTSVIVWIAKDNQPQLLAVRPYSLHLIYHVSKTWVFIREYILGVSRRCLLTLNSRPTASGHTLNCYFCKVCGTRVIHSTPGKKIMSVKGGCIEGLDWSRARHIWCSRAVSDIVKRLLAYTNALM